MGLEEMELEKVVHATHAFWFCLFSFLLLFIFAYLCVGRTLVGP